MTPAEREHCNHECVCAVLAMMKATDSPCDISGCKFDTRTHPSTHQILTRIRAAIHEEEYEVECIDDPVVDMFVVDRVIEGEIGKLQA